MCVYIYHIFFIHSSNDGHLGCFKLFTIINMVAMNTEVHICFLIRSFIFSGYRPGVE